MNISTFKMAVVRKHLFAIFRHVLALIELLFPEHGFSKSQLKRIESYKKEQKLGTVYLPTISSREDKIKRNLKIIESVKKGLSLKKISQKFQLGIERVRQILRQQRSEQS